MCFKKKEGGMGVLEFKTICFLLNVETKIILIMLLVSFPFLEYPAIKLLRLEGWTKDSEMPHTGKCAIEPFTMETAM